MRRRNRPLVQPVVSKLWGALVPVMRVVRSAALTLLVPARTPACSTTRAYPDRPIAYGRVTSAYDEGFRRGIQDGRWAAHRDLGKRYRTSFWDDGRYRHGTEGYRSQYGSRTVYAEGFRAGYEQGYFESRGRAYERRRY